MIITFESMQAMADALTRLAADAGYLRDHGAPSERMLAAAPILDDWSTALTPTTCLVGRVSGHPRLGDRPLIRTSDLVAIDPAARWARTASRFYRLGTLAADFGARGKA